MFEKVNPFHPDKVADRIAGAIVDLAYQREANPKIAVEVLIGHSYAYIIIESSVKFNHNDVEPIVNRIIGKQIITRLLSIPQDKHLAKNQDGAIRCGDNGIFKGCPPTFEQQLLTDISSFIYDDYQSDGKYLIGAYRRDFDNDVRNDKIVPSDDKTRSYAITICQSNGSEDQILASWFNAFQKIGGEANGPCTTFMLRESQKIYFSPIINPLGEWTGGPDVDCGATNRKLGSDMGDGVTGGGLHGKDLSKADVSINIVCHQLARTYNSPVEACCSIGDELVTFRIENTGEVFTRPYEVIVGNARKYIEYVGGFEKFAEWGLIRP